MNITITYEQALAKASPQLRRQMEWSVNLLRKAEPLMLRYDKENGGWLGFSGGKDSQALFHIAQLAGIKFKGYFSPTSIDPPPSDTLYPQKLPRGGVHTAKREYLHRL